MGIFSATVDKKAVSGLKPKEKLQSASFEEINLVLSSKLSYRDTADTLNRVFHRDSDKRIRVSTLENRVESFDKSLADGYMSKAEEILGEYNIDSQTGIITSESSVPKSVREPLWANYFKYVCSKEVFCKIDHILTSQLMRWGYRRHPRKGRSWTNHKYFVSDGRRQWVFGCTIKEKGKDKLLSLIKMSDTTIERYVKVKVKGNANPYDSQWDEYFKKRADKANRKRKAKGARVAKVA